jgi:hypothetical protein
MSKRARRHSKSNQRLLKRRAFLYPRRREGDEGWRWSKQRRRKQSRKRRSFCFLKKSEEGFFVNISDSHP